MERKENIGLHGKICVIRNWKGGWVIYNCLMCLGLYMLSFDGDSELLHLFGVVTCGLDTAKNLIR